VYDVGNDIYQVEALSIHSFNLQLPVHLLFQRKISISGLWQGKGPDAIRYTAGVTSVAIQEHCKWLNLVQAIK
jgi:hypothetical protein